MREMIVNSGDMSIVSDSHTRYGTQGSLSIGEGGPELAKAMLGKYYEIYYPEVIGVFMTGAPKPWVGPMDVALSIIGNVFKNNFVEWIKLDNVLNLHIPVKCFNASNLSLCTFRLISIVKHIDI